MKFGRCAYPKNHALEVTPRKLAAARRAVQSARDKVALFPELVSEVETPEERIDALKAGAVANARYWRALQAKNWREARRRLESMPESMRRGVLKYWDHWVAKGNASDPVYLLGMCRSAIVEGVSYWTRMRQLRQLQLAGQGKLKIGPVLAAQRSQPVPIHHLHRSPQWYADRRKRKVSRKASGRAHPVFG